MLSYGKHRKKKFIADGLNISAPFDLLLPLVKNGQCLMNI